MRATKLLELIVQVWFNKFTPLYIDLINRVSHKGERIKWELKKLRYITLRCRFGVGFQLQELVRHFDNRNPTLQKGCLKLLHLQVLRSGIWSDLGPDFWIYFVFIRFSQFSGLLYFSCFPFIFSSDRLVLTILSTSEANLAFIGSLTVPSDRLLQFWEFS